MFSVTSFRASIYLSYIQHLKKQCDSVGDAKPRFSWERGRRPAPPSGDRACASSGPLACLRSPGLAWASPLSQGVVLEGHTGLPGCLQSLCSVHNAHRDPADRIVKTAPRTARAMRCSARAIHGWKAYASPCPALQAARRWGSAQERWAGAGAATVHCEPAGPTWPPGAGSCVGRENI